MTKYRLLGIALCLATMTGLAILWSVHETDRVCSLAKSWIEGVRVEWEHRDHTREVVVSKPSEGEAWEAYSEALRLASQMSDEDLERTQDDQGINLELIKPSELAELRERWSPVLRQVKLGASRRDARFPIDWSVTSYDLAVESATFARSIGEAAVVEVVVTRSADPEASVDLALATLTFGADLLRGPTAFHGAMGGHVFSWMLAHGLSDQTLRGLPESSLRLLSVGLRKLDLGLSLRSESVEFEDTIPFGFSTRRVIAAAVLELGEIADATRRDNSRTWELRQRFLARQLERVRSSDNRMVGLVGMNWQNRELSRATRVVVLRLARMAVGWYLPGEVEPIREPVGEAFLRIDRTGDDITIRSSMFYDDAGTYPIERRVVPR